MYWPAGALGISEVASLDFLWSLSSTLVYVCPTEGSCYVLLIEFEQHGITHGRTSVAAVGGTSGPDPQGLGVTWVALSLREGCGGVLLSLESRLFRRSLLAGMERPIAQRLGSRLGASGALLQQRNHVRSSGCGWSCHLTSFAVTVCRSAGPRLLHRPSRRGPCWASHSWALGPCRGADLCTPVGEASLLCFTIFLGPGGPGGFPRPSPRNSPPSAGQDTSMGSASC